MLFFKELFEMKNVEFNNRDIRGPDSEKFLQKLTKEREAE